MFLLVVESLLCEATSIIDVGAANAFHKLKPHLVHLLHPLFCVDIYFKAVIKLEEPRTIKGLLLGVVQRFLRGHGLPKLMQWTLPDEDCRLNEARRVIPLARIGNSGVPQKLRVRPQRHQNLSEPWHQRIVQNKLLNLSWEQSVGYGRTDQLFQKLIKLLPLSFSHQGRHERLLQEL